MSFSRLSSGLVFDGGCVSVCVSLDFVSRNWISTKFNGNEFEVSNNNDRLCCSQEQTGAGGMMNKNQTMNTKNTKRNQRLSAVQSPRQLT